MNGPILDWSCIVESKEQLQEMMVEALYRQGLLTQEQRQTLRQTLQYEPFEDGGEG